MNKEGFYAETENYKMFYAGEQDEAAKAFQQESGWHMIWGSDYQGLNGDTWVVYRTVEDLPKWLQEYAREEEAKEGANRQSEPNRCVSEDKYVIEMFDQMTSEAFAEFLRKLQKSPYSWPNLYFAWEKEDESLLMIGVRSTQYYHVLKHELEEDRLPTLLRLQKETGMAGEIVFQREYVTGLYDINPNTVHMRQDNEGPVVRYDPVDALVEEVRGCKYLGAWEDPNVLMDNPYGYSRTLACGRWDLAISHICPEKLPEKRQELDSLIRAADAADRDAPRANPDKGELEI